MAKFYLNPSKAVWYTPFQTGGKQPSRQGEIFLFLKEMSILTSLKLWRYSLHKWTCVLNARIRIRGKTFYTNITTRNSPLVLSAGFNDPTLVHGYKNKEGGQLLIHIVLPLHSIPNVPCFHECKHLQEMQQDLPVLRWGKTIYAARFWPNFALQTRSGQALYVKRYKSQFQ